MFRMRQEGELNENTLGESSGMNAPCSGQAKSSDQAMVWPSSVSRAREFLLSVASSSGASKLSTARVPPQVGERIQRLRSTVVFCLLCTEDGQSSRRCHAENSCRERGVSLERGFMPVDTAVEVALFHQLSKQFCVRSLPSTQPDSILRCRGPPCARTHRPRFPERFAEPLLFRMKGNVVFLCAQKKAEIVLYFSHCRNG